MRLALLLVLAWTTACTAYTSAGFALPTAAQRTGASGDVVQFVDGSLIERPYVVLGKVHAHGRCNLFFGFLGNDKVVAPKFVVGALLFSVVSRVPV